MNTCRLVMIVAFATGTTFADEATSTSSATTSTHHIDPASPQGLQELFGYTAEALPLVSAHRGGAAPGLPENCIATFADTLEHTWAILEIDPRYSRDGEIVIHHDSTLERTTTGRGAVNEHTLEELRSLHLKDPEGLVTEYRIPTLDEVLRWARGKTVLVLDEKDVPVDARVRKIQQHQAQSYAMLIAYSLDDARTCYRLDPNIMMEVMIPNRQQLRAFEEADIPWSNIVAFVGHTPPQDGELLQMIHDRGSSCIVGTSRNLDRTFRTRQLRDAAALEQEYRGLLQFGADVIETDLPRDIGAMLYETADIPASKARFFK